MFLDGLTVELPGHSIRRGEVIDGERICIPINLEAWIAWLREVHEQGGTGSVGLHVSSTDSPSMIALAIGPYDLDGAWGSLHEGTEFGFLVDAATLRQLRSAIDMAITVAESAPKPE